MDPSADFLMKEYERRSQWMLKDDELGEKRAGFFLTLTGVAGAVFTFGVDRGPLIYAGWRNSLAAAALSGVLLALGIVTGRRLLMRNIVTDRHFLALRDIARQFVPREQAQAMKNAFGELYEPMPERSLRVIGVGKGGWFEIVALVNAILGGVCPGALAYWAFQSPSLSLIVMLAGIGLTWSLQRQYGANLTKHTLRVAREFDRQQCGNTG
jgi:predicted phage tail protein